MPTVIWLRERNMREKKPYCQELSISSNIMYNSQFFDQIINPIQSLKLNTYKYMKLALNY